MHHKSLILSRVQSFQAMERRLTPTNYYSFLEFSVCCIAGIALGILLNTTATGYGYTVGSILLLVARGVYSFSRVSANVRSAWGRWGEGEYERLYREAIRKSEGRDIGMGGEDRDGDHGARGEKRV